MLLSFYSLANLMQNSEGGGLGANDPSAINFLGHQRNFEDVVNAIQEGRKPSVDGVEARRAVALICAIYESAKNNGKRVELWLIFEPTLLIRRTDPVGSFEGALPNDFQIIRANLPKQFLNHSE